tara:strand:+ start:63 stop:266 length:204 start_codon:yes stop_codon:yes gene_type:complete
MEITKKINKLKESIIEIDQLIEELISSLEAQHLRAENKGKKVLEIKDELKTNIKKIDKIIENHNANS